jgi:hypothetical protein
MHFWIPIRQSLTPDRSHKCRILHDQHFSAKTHILHLSSHLNIRLMSGTRITNYFSSTIRELQYYSHNRNLHLQRSFGEREKQTFDCHGNRKLQNGFRNEILIQITYIFFCEHSHCHLRIGQFIVDRAENTWLSNTEPELVIFYT